MNQELYEVYLKAFCDDLWLFKSGWVIFKRNDKLSLTISKLERAHFGKYLDGRETFETREFQAAMKTWNELKDTPLMKALE